MPTSRSPGEFGKAGFVAQQILLIPCPSTVTPLMRPC